MKSIYIMKSMDEKDLLFYEKVFQKKRFFKRKGFLLFFTLEKEMKWKLFLPTLKIKAATTFALMYIHKYI